ncbi:hypothetical protein KC349_g4554 [Hortaea werneckii]|nr:hypothetical protein KC349_g4554 [Hortaea werneckii]
MSGLVEKLKPHKPLHEGAKVPAGTLLKEDNAEQATVDLSKVGGKYIIIGVPGAFTPPCSSHVPGFVEQASQFAEKGIKGIYVVGVNDQFTMAAWKEKLGGDKAENVHFLADDTNSERGPYLGVFTKQAGMDFDATGLLGGVRSQRYAAIVEDGTVKSVFVEDQAPSVTVTSADNVLKAL